MAPTVETMMGIENELMIGFGRFDTYPPGTKVHSSFVTPPQATTGVANPGPLLSLDDLEKAVAQIEALPKAQWVLVSPTGQMCTSPLPRDILRFLMQNCRVEDLFPLQPLGGVGMGGIPSGRDPG